jgi:hypothetical protein
MALVEIAKFTTKSEAEAAAGALRTGGAPVFVFDDGLGGAAYNLALSAEGYRVLAPAELKEELQEALASFRAAAIDED